MSADSHPRDTLADGFIGPVTTGDLDDAALNRATDPGWQRMAPAEMEYIRRWRNKRDPESAPDSQPPAPDNLAGLALSGGGIRSATFSLGIMQALAHRGVLKRMDYLSTVSGGGYIGSALSWLVSDAAHQEVTRCDDDRSSDRPLDFRLGLDPQSFPFGTDDPAPRPTVDGPPERSRDLPFQKRLLKYLGAHGYYLTPGKGVTAISLLGVILRGTLLNLLVWIPVFTMFFLAGLYLSDRAADHLGYAQSSAAPGPADKPISLLILPHILDGLQEATTADDANASVHSKAIADVRSDLDKLLGFELFLLGGTGVFAVLLLVLLVYSFETWRKQETSAQTSCKWYRRRRFVEKFTAVAIPVGIATLVIGSLPIVGVWLHGWMLAGGPGAVLVGAAMTVRQFFTVTMKGDTTPTGLVASIGAGLLLYGVFLLAYEIAYLGFSTAGEPMDGALVACALGVGLVWTLLLGWCVNLNHISIHRYYRDRLMETYMPDIRRALACGTGMAVGADATPLHQVANPQDPSGPYHIVNTTAILVNSDNPTYRRRGGDNFILSPLYCGCNATGWAPTETFMGGRMTLASAMAISGAAVNPNAGVGGAGPTRNKTVSLAMSLLNLRLGYWAHNPAKPQSHLPNHLIPGGYSFGNALGIAAAGFSERRGYIQISDGGHFENNAVYELVRRRVGLIIVCDGGEDHGFSFSDLQTTVQRVWTDFGARISALLDATPDRMIPIPVGKEASYPKGIGFAERGFMVCEVAYNDGTKGTLLYLKTTLIRDVSFRVKGYAAQNPDFPDQSTIDQFFDRVQFDAYRELGYQIASQMLDSALPRPEPSAPGDGDSAPAPPVTIEAFIKAFGAAA